MASSFLPALAGLRPAVAAGTDQLNHLRQAAAGWQPPAALPPLRRHRRLQASAAARQQDLPAGPASPDTSGKGAASQRKEPVDGAGQSDAATLELQQQQRRQQQPQSKGRKTTPAAAALQRQQQQQASRGALPSWLGQRQPARAADVSRQPMSAAQLQSGRQRAQAAAQQAVRAAQQQRPDQAIPIIAADGPAALRSSPSSSGSGSSALDGGGDASTAVQPHQRLQGAVQQQLADQQRLGKSRARRAVALKQPERHSGRQDRDTLAGEIADTKRARREAADLQRARLAALCQGPNAAAEGDGTRAGQQPLEPGWELDAAEVLCACGMSPEAAVQVLLAAQACALGRPQAVAAPAAAEELRGAGDSGNDSGSSKAAQPAAAGSMAASGGGELEPAVPPSLITAARVQAVCDELLHTAKLRVRQLSRALAAAPQLLACTPAEIREQVGACGNQQGIRESREVAASARGPRCLPTPQYSLPSCLCSTVC